MAKKNNDAQRTASSFELKMKKSPDSESTVATNEKRNRQNMNSRKLFLTNILVWSEFLPVVVIVSVGDGLWDLKTQTATGSY